MEPWDTRSPQEGHAEILDGDACLTLLATMAIGRVAFVAADGRLEVVPVNFTLDGDVVVFRTSRGGKLAAVEHGMPLAFEVDDTEPALHTGWSVLLHGRAEIVGDSGDVRRLAELAGAPWVRMSEPGFVRLRPSAISGRRLPLHPGGVTVEPADEV